MIVFDDNIDGLNNRGLKHAFKTKVLKRFLCKVVYKKNPD